MAELAEVTGGEPSAAGRRIALAGWGLAGAALVGLQVLLLLISPRFGYDAETVKEPIGRLVGLLIAGGVVYLLAAWRLRNAPKGRNFLIWVLAVGLAMRALTLGSTPMLEDDFYRYLWDGGVTASGHNPYAYSPKEVTAPGDGSRPVPQELRDLAAGSGEVVRRVNHPEFRTIYPPVAQAAFTLAHWLRPWSLTALRLVLLLFDVAALGLLLLLLRALKLPAACAALYWWNPLLVKEVYNSAHMEVIILPFLLGALLLAARGRTFWACGALALAAGAKVWPVLLLPLVLRPVLAEPRRLAPAALAFVLPAALLAWPVLAAGLDPQSGFTAYAGLWEMNDALYMLLHWGTDFLAPGRGHLLARGLVMALLAAWTAWLVHRPATGPADLCGRALLVVAALFLLSPTQFPWYYLWMLPLLALRPRGSLLLLTALLPIYYLRFGFQAAGQVAVFDYGIVWIEFVPVWCLLAWEFWTARRRRLEIEAGAAA